MLVFINFGALAPLPPLRVFLEKGNLSQLIGNSDNQAADGGRVLDAFHAGDFGGPHLEVLV
jgi:hypothetical protein